MSLLNVDLRSVRYAQEYLYSDFSNAGLSVGETYVALVMGFLDPGAIPPIKIFEYNKQFYCIDTRRLTIAKELQHQKEYDVLEKFSYKYITEDNQGYKLEYSNLINERLPSMMGKGLDGSSIKLYPKRVVGRCCFNVSTNSFRDDLCQHIAQDHLKMNFYDFKRLNIYECNKCHKECKIYIKKPSNHSNYRFIKEPCCKPQERELHRMSQPFTEVSLSEIRDKFLELKPANLRRMSDQVGTHNRLLMVETSNNNCFKQCCVVLVGAVLLIIFLTICFVASSIDEI